MEFTIKDVPLSELEARLVQPASETAWFASGAPEQPLLKTTIGDIRIEVARRKSVNGAGFNLQTIETHRLESAIRDRMDNKARGSIEFFTYLSGEQACRSFGATFDEIRAELSRRYNLAASCLNRYRFCSTPVSLATLTREDLQTMGKNPNEPVVRRIAAMKLLREFDNSFRPTFGFDAEIA